MTVAVECTLHRVIHTADTHQRAGTVRCAPTLGTPPAGCHGTDPVALCSEPDGHTHPGWTRCPTCDDR